MITAVFIEERGQIALTIEGHADNILPGDDPTCAAVSIFAYTLLQKIKWYNDYGSFKEPPKATVKAGDAEFVCRPRRKAYATILNDFHFVETGLRLLEKSSPEKVHVTLFECEQSLQK